MTDEMRKLTVDDVEDAPSPTRHKKELDEVVGAETFGFNVFVADPGQPIPWGMHRHPDQEELMYVVAGRVRVDTPDEDGAFTLDAGDALFVPEDTAQRAVAVGDEPARVVAAGAPKSGDAAILEEPCDACGEATGRDAEPLESGDGYVLYCSECGAEGRTIVAGPE